MHAALRTIVRSARAGRARRAVHTRAVLHTHIHMQTHSSIASYVRNVSDVSCRGNSAFLDGCVRALVPGTQLVEEQLAAFVDCHHK